MIKPARQAAFEAQRKNKGNEGIFCGAAIELKNGSIITGKNSPLMHASSSLVLNAIKELAEIPDKIHLLSPGIIESIKNLKFQDRLDIIANLNGLMVVNKAVGAS